MTSAGNPRWAPYFFLAPFLLIFGVFMAYPLLQSMVLALQQSFGPKYTTFVGFQNFANLLNDSDFYLALRNTVTFTFGSIFLQLPMSLGLALLLNHPRIRGRTLYRLIFFSPSLVGLVFVAMMFAVMLGEHNGLVNTLLRDLAPGWPPEFPWLRQYVMASLILAALWMYTGFNMIYFLAALQNLNPDLLEAADIDGANPWQRFLHIVIPGIKPVAGFVVLLSVIGSLQLFELPYVLLEGPGPEKRGLTLVMYLYQNGFERNDLGFASAIGWTLAIVLMALAFIQRRLTREDEE
jgi:ABC-type sugar transport system permease subunit